MGAGIYLGQNIYPAGSELSQLPKQDGENALPVRFRDRLNEVINRKSALLICPDDSSYSIASLRKSTYQGTRRASLIDVLPRNLKTKRGKYYRIDLIDETMSN